MMSTPAYDFRHWDGRPPKVSCLCPTYGRPHLIGEAIGSFLRQDYPGEKELIVLNDHPEMPLSGEWPGVTLVNLTERCGSLGGKRNQLAALATGDVFLPWDDDDICLPHRISVTIARMRNRHYFKPTDLWWWTGHGAEFHQGAMAHAMAGYSRTLFDACGGYPLIDAGEDQGFDHCVKRLGLWDSAALDRDEAFYIYRMNHVRTYHVSGYGYGRGWDECAAHVAETVQPGMKAITAEWSLPYDRIIAAHIAEERAPLTPRPGEPLLSVCVSVKNRSRVPHAGGSLDLFPRCVASLARVAETLGPIELVVADFGSDDHPLGQWIGEAGRGLHIRLIHADGPFSRGRGLNLAASHASSESLFLCDADLLVTPAAIEEGLRALAKGAASFPVIRHLAADGSMAAAGVDGYGIAFVTRGLFRAAGGVPEFHSWGGEDNLFHQRVSSLAPVRREATDAILHQWHPEEVRDCYYMNRRRSDYEQSARDPNAPLDIPAAVSALPETTRVLHAVHPHWSGFIHLLRDGRFLRAGHDGGMYEECGTGLTLKWDHWPPETFQRANDAAPFTVREIRLW
ncbi:glycosyltransferase [Luteolibacter ambystomatis]|uniref:Glycosyltransferase n=1 Tax=Luteolibacter ambystomatis TaxID=2824561 RepID=A0A975J327_9BACT|nr:glycosyltransferase [Luteolibacter ambystomatis]QUE53103.1 glycosyltransferase [Luteolibacter ambystomatis]